MSEIQPRGPDFIPYSEWIVIDEKRRRRRSWLMGGATALTIVGIGSALMIPILNRRVVIKDLAQRFLQAEQVVTVEERIGPNDVKFDRKVIEEAKGLRRVEIDDGNIMIFASPDGGSKLDRRRRNLLTYERSSFTGTSFSLVKDLLDSASRDVRSSAQKSEMSGGVLKLKSDGITYLITPGSGARLATVDVQTDTDLGPTTVVRWQFEKVAPNVSQFYPATFSRVRPRPAQPTVRDVDPEETFTTQYGPAHVIRVDFSEKGDLFIADSCRYKLDYQVRVTDGATYAWVPSGISQDSTITGETLRQHLAYRKRGTNLAFPFTVTVEVRPVDQPKAKPHVIRRTFDRPTCSIVPDYEFGLVATDAPITGHRMRSYLCEASLAETGFGLVRYANADVPVKNAANALIYYRFASTYFGQVDLRTYNASQARIYFSIYRCYDAANQEELGKKALQTAAAKNNGRDPWLDQKINEAFVREGLIEE